MSAYTDYFEGELANAALDSIELKESLAELPAVG